MKILAINGSPRRNGNTSHVIGALTSLLLEKGMVSDQLILSDNNIEYCSGCLECEKDGGENKCWINDDMTNSISKQLFNYDMLIFCTPTYFDMPTAQMKCFMDRCNMILAKIIEKKFLYSAVIIGQTEAGSLENNFSSLKNFCDICEMKLIGNPLYIIARDLTDAQDNENTLFEVERYTSALITSLQ